MATETVTGVLAALRDEISDFVIVNKNNATVNFQFGQLIYKSGGFVEFKAVEV